MAERLHKFLAQAGVASRREVERWMLQGRVTVDGLVVTALGTTVNAEQQRIRVDGRLVARKPALVYWLLHKPVGYLSTTRDPHGRPTLLDLAPRGPRIFPVGRLDADSEGLILLTNDGALTQALTHPASGVPKEYHVLVAGPVHREQVTRLRAGIALDDTDPTPAAVHLLAVAADGTWLRFILREGRKRQIRRMCAAVGLAVLRLRRVRLDGLILGDLPSGHYRSLTSQEVTRLRRAAGMDHEQASGDRR